ncbi:MAG: hypothetical protein ABIZ80_10870 [Bryobacteraceae bacterium]
MTRRNAMKSIVAGSLTACQALAAAPSKERVHLIIDEQSVASNRGAAFHLNQAKKHPGNPVLLPSAPDKWDSLQVSWPATVLYSETDRLFRCWYSGLDAMQSERPLHIWAPGYAESRDGIHWVKPDLGQVSYLGRDSNQIRIGWKNDDEYAVSFLSFVFENPFPDAPASQRFGGYWPEVAPPSNGQFRIRKRLTWSPDGKRWTPAGIAYELQNGFVYDLAQLIHVPDAPDPRKRVLGYAQLQMPRKWDGKAVRQIGLMTGENFENVEGSADPLLLAPEQGIDEELHFASVSRVGDTFLMLFESDRFSRNPIRGDLRLAVSGDGRSFRRVHKNQALVETGARGAWDENLLVTTTSAIQAVGDELYIFYLGCPNVYNSWHGTYAVKGDRRGSLFYPAYAGLATLPRDRYSYAAGPGSITTRPVEIRAGLWLNADGGSIEVRALDSAGKVAAKGRLGNERSQTVYRKVAWSGGPPSGALQMELRLAPSDRLYSFRCD